MTIDFTVELDPVELRDIAESRHNTDIRFLNRVSFAQEVMRKLQDYCTPQSWDWRDFWFKTKIIKYNLDAGVFHCQIKLI